MTASASSSLHADICPEPGEMATATITVLSLAIEATPAAVELARSASRALALSAGASGARAEEVALAVEEAVGDVVRHAYADAFGAGAVRVCIDADDGALEVVVLDDDATGPSEREPSARTAQSFAYIDELADAWAVDPRSTVGTQVWMRFALEGERG